MLDERHSLQRMSKEMQCDLGHGAPPRSPTRSPPPGPPSPTPEDFQYEHTGGGNQLFDHYKTWVAWQHGDGRPVPRRLAHVTPPPARPCQGWATPGEATRYHHLQQAWDERWYDVFHVVGDERYFDVDPNTPYHEFVFGDFVAFCRNHPHDPEIPRLRALFKAAGYS